MKGRTAVVGVGVALGAAACSAFGGSDATPPNSADAAADGATSEGGDTNGSGDGGGPDGAVIVDGGDGGSSNDAAGSQFCAMQMPLPFLCQDFDESSLLAGWYQGSFAGQGHFNPPAAGPASLTLETGRAHGHAPSTVNEAFNASKSFATALPNYTFTIRFHIGATVGDVEIAVLTTINGPLTLAASSAQLTLTAPNGTLKVDMDTTIDQVATVQYVGNQLTLQDAGGMADSLTNNVIQLQSVRVGIGMPSSAPVDTFIDYYMVTTP